MTWDGKYASRQVSSHVEMPKSKQHWCLIELWKLGQRLVRVNIRQDHSYPTQGHARVEAWTSVGWQPLVSWFGGELPVQSKRFGREGTRADYEGVVQQLLDEAAEALFS